MAFLEKLKSNNEEWARRLQAKEENVIMGECSACPQLLKTFPVLTLIVSHPEKLPSPGQTGMPYSLCGPDVFRARFPYYQQG